MEARTRAQRVGVEGRVEVVRPGRGEIKAVRRIPFADLRHRVDAMARLVDVFDPPAFGAGERGKLPREAILVAGSSPALLDLERALRDGEAARAVPGILRTPAAAVVGDAHRALARVEGDRIERGAGRSRRALRELEPGPDPAVADARVVERRPAHHRQ